MFNKKNLASSKIISFEGSIVWMTFDGISRIAGIGFVCASIKYWIKSA